MEEQTASDPAGVRDLTHGAVRGALAAMTMSGMRAFTVSAGLVEEPPPQAIVRQRIRFLSRPKVKGKGRRRVIEELLHWTYGAGGGAVFAALPREIRGRLWAGPAYGVIFWFGFEAGIAPVLGLKQAKEPRLADRASLLVDHLLYGFVLTETRRRDAR